MSSPFKKAMNDISDMLKEVYSAHKAVIIPGSGTYAMEAVARQFATGKKALVLRNGYFSYRWTQIFDQCGIPTEHTVLKARPIDALKNVDGRRATKHGLSVAEGGGLWEGDLNTQQQYAPHPINKVVATIEKERPGVVFAPHVETSTGMILPDDYIMQLSKAVHSVGGLLVLDCIASGTVWVDMKKLGVDALISAPQKGWTGPSCAGLVMLSERGTDAVRATRSSSFVCDLRKWLEVMETYENGGFMYHATMPTDALVQFRDVMLETRGFGFKKATENAWVLGDIVHKMLCEEKGLVRVAAPGFQAPGVVVVHTNDAGIAGKFAGAGTQIAAGVPFMIGEPEGTKTFRIGLFGLDKLIDPQRTALQFKGALDAAVPGEVSQLLSGYIQKAPWTVQA
mmetsp:Transcript_27356/g.83174  ORF Transcript_27356/g.83174 Transcript_27356/m.83174 type:complete len:396 (-) Transcript_27356:688-1875(-)